MKIIKNLKAREGTTGLGLGLIVLLAFVLQSCGKTEESGIISKQLEEIEESVVGVDAATRGVADKPRVDNDKILRGLIENEKQERIAADNEINARIDALAFLLVEFQAQMAQEIKRLDERDDELAAGIESNTQNFNTKMAEMTNAWTAENEKMKEAFGDDITSLNLTLENLKKSMSDLSDDIYAEMDKREKEADARHKAARDALKAQMLASISSLSSDVQAKFKSLQSDIALLDADLKSKLYMGLKNLSSELQAEVNTLNARRDVLKGQLLDLIDLNDSSLRSEIARVDSEMVALDIQANENKLALEQELSRVENDLSNDILKQEVALRDLIKRSVEDVRAELIERQDEAVASLTANFEAQVSSLKGNIEELAETQRTGQAKAREDLISAMNQMSDAQNQQFMLLTDELFAARMKAVKDKNELLFKIEEARIESQNALQEESALRIVTEERLQDALKQVEEEQNAQHKEIEGRLTNLIQEVDANATDSYNLLLGKLDDLDTKTSADMAEINSKIIAERVKTDQQVHALEAELVKTNDAILNMAQEHAAFKAEVARTYATKQNLAAVKDYTAAVHGITQQLGRKIDLNDESVRAYMTASFNSLKDNLKNEIKAVKAEVADLREDFKSHVDSYKSAMKNMRSEFNDKVKAARTSLLSSIHETNKNSRDQLLGEITAVSFRFEAMSQEMKEAFSAQLEDVEMSLETKVASNKAEIESAKIEAQQNLNLAVAEEQKHRNEMQKELDSLVEGLQEVAEIATRGERIAKQNSRDIKQMQSDFAAEKKRVAEQFDVLESDVDAKLKAMKDDYEKKIGAVALQAKAAVANLGEEMQKGFANTMTEIAELHQSQAATNNAMINYIAAQKKSDQARRDFEAAIMQPKQESLDALFKVVSSLGTLHLTFFDALNPDQDNIPFYDVMFRPIMTKCGGNAEATFANALGMDSFQLLAKEYIKLMALHSLGTRGGNLFFGMDRIAGGDNLHNIILTSLMRQTEGNDVESCHADIEAWARLILIGDVRKHAQSAAILNLRNMIQQNKEILRAVTIFKQAADALKTPNQAMETVIKNFLAAGVDPQKAMFGDDGMAFKYALALIEATQRQQMINDRKVAYDAIVRSQQAAAEENAQLKEDFNKAKNNLDGLINDFKQSTGKKLDNLAAKVDGIEGSMKKVLDLVATLSQRNGYHDLREYVVAAGKPLGYVPVKDIITFKPRITEVQHFFKGRGLKNNSGACTGDTVMSGGGIRTYHQHGGWGKCWVNFRGIPGAHWYGTIATVWYRLFGSMHRVQVTADGYNETFDFISNGMVTDKTKVHKGYKNGVFDVKGAGRSLLRTDVRRNWHGTVVKFTPERLEDGEVAERGASSSYRIQLYSPIVLDYVSVGTMKSVSAENSSVYFDLDNDGIKEKTGWVSGMQGALLGVDLNGNGRLDNGAELFGEATKLPNGKTAQNGYAALAQHDSNRDGKITEADPIFKKLVVWRDYNADGVTDSKELVPLADTGVSAVGVAFETVAEAESVESGNVYKYKGKFWGPKQCGEEGCKSYDVFFSTSSTLLSDSGIKIND